MSQEHKLSLEIPVCKLKKKRDVHIYFKSPFFSSSFSKTEHLKDNLGQIFQLESGGCRVGGK